MKYEEMLSRLKSIEKPTVVGYGCYDTGTEFKIISSEGVYYCMGGGTWPIKGPHEYTETVYNAAIKLMKGDTYYAEEIYDDLIDGKDLGLTQIERRLLSKMNEDDFILLFDMIENDCLPDIKYYFYEDLCINHNYYYKSYDEAYDHLIKEFTKSGPGDVWEHMTDEELTEWIELLEYELSHKKDTS